MLTITVCLSKLYIYMYTDRQKLDSPYYNNFVNYEPPILYSYEQSLPPHALSYQFCIPYHDIPNYHMPCQK